LSQIAPPVLKNPPPFKLTRAITRHPFHSLYQAKRVILRRIMIGNHRTQMRQTCRSTSLRPAAQNIISPRRSRRTTARVASSAGRTGWVVKAQKDFSGPRCPELSLSNIVCCYEDFLARVLSMSLSFSQKSGAQTCCRMCRAKVSSGIVRLVI